MTIFSSSGVSTYHASKKPWRWEWRKATLKAAAMGVGLERI